MAFRSSDGASTGPHPTEVPGYDRARALGLLPTVPAEPPTPVVMSSRKTSLLALAFTATMFVLCPVFDANGSTFVIPGVLAVAGIAAGILLPLRLVRREAAAGYARSETRIALDVFDRERRFRSGPGPSGAAWDLRGLWLLDGDDRPVRPPVPGVLPPGHYPSPNRPGQLEFWTGRDWLYGYREPDVPFLDESSPR